MLDVEEKEIDGRTYRYQPLMLKPSRTLFDKLVQRFGPALANALDGLQSADIGEEMEVMQALGSLSGSAAGLLRGVVQGLDSKTHAEICDTLAKQTTVEWSNEETGQTKYLPLADVRELLFGRNLLTEFRVVAFCLQVQYEDFLAPVQSLATTAMALRAKAGSRSGSPKASTGLPIESPQANDTPTA